MTAGAPRHQAVLAEVSTALPLGERPTPGPIAVLPEPRDVFVVPKWAWHEHVNGSASDDACLFTFNDLPVMHALGLYREEAYGDNQGRQPLTS